MTFSRRPHPLARTSSPRRSATCTTRSTTIDIAGRPGGNQLFLVDQKDARYVDCGDVALPYGGRLVDDVLNRTETANPQVQTFLAMEVALDAQAAAQRLTLPRR